ncbi:MAG: twin-arginine translocase subunit TatC [Propionibacteriales bacterium]|nr:twin-arginine translocase subunit TatC [Propionibacteriales bacterium]
MASATAAEGGRMTLVEHLRELRSRVFKSVVAVLLATVVSWIFYDYLFDLLSDPFEQGIEDYADLPDHEARMIQGTIAGPLLLQIKISLLAGVVVASPVWLYQIWAFIMPGLHSNEKKWTMIFSAVAGPLFMAGVALGYAVLPKGIDVLLSFTQPDVGNYIELGTYLSFALRMLLAFGVALEIPLFVVLLNLAGVISAKQLATARRWIILLAFVFAAVATPSADPVSMLALAIPMTLLFLASEMLAHFVDRRRLRKRREMGFSDLDDDRTSPLEVDRDRADDRPSSLSEPD